MKLSAIILAGGKSQRLGRNKVLEPLGNKRLIEHVIDKIASLTQEIIIVTSPGKPLPFNNPKIKLASDIYPNQGPLGGLHAGLIASSSTYNLIVACDLPFLNINLLSYLISLSPDYDLVIPKSKKGFEPLLAVYSRSCLKAIEGLLKKGHRQIIELLPLVKARYVQPQEIEKFDPQYLSFFNINTQEDLERAKAIYRSLSEGLNKQVNPTPTSSSA